MEQPRRPGSAEAISAQAASEARAAESSPPIASTRDYSCQTVEGANAQFVTILGSARRVGLYGGTFDPVHAGHLIAATEVADRLGLDKVIFLPAGEPPHKRNRSIAAAHHRITMLQLATAGRDRLAVSSFDVGETGPSYTAQLLRRAHAAASSPHEFYFLMGEDSLGDFPTWREPATIARLARLVVVTRPEADVALEHVIARVPELRDRVECVSIPLISTSSGDLRHRIATGRPIAYQVPTEVERYIRAHQLYQ